MLPSSPPSCHHYDHHHQHKHIHHHHCAIITVPSSLCHHHCVIMTVLSSLCHHDCAIITCVWSSGTLQGSTSQPHTPHTRARAVDTQCTLLDLRSGRTDKSNRHTALSLNLILHQSVTLSPHFAWKNYQSFLLPHSALPHWFRLTLQELRPSHRRQSSSPWNALPQDTPQGTGGSHPIEWVSEWVRERERDERER